MRDIIGRESDIKRIAEYVNSGNAELVAVYGRRRVGKTFLIKRVFNEKFTFYFSGAENASKKQQLFNFTTALNKYSGKENPVAKDWQNAFVQLEQYLQRIKTKGRKIIFIDELPWLDNFKSGFLSAFEYFWNTFASSQDEIFMVICGSATSWMMNKIIKNRGGLHNRVTRQILLEPFTLNETDRFLKSKKMALSRFQIAEYYMILGGIPYYLEQLEKSLSLSQNIDKLFFKKNATLRDEYTKLYSSLFKSPEKYMKIIEALAQKRKGLTRDEIVEFSKISNGGGLTSMLEELELCGFISINNNFTTKKNLQLYQLIDFYSLFYLHFEKDKRGTNDDYWSSLMDTGKHQAWAGYSFELLCQTHISQIKRALSIGGVVSYSSGWRSKDAENGAQIDFLIDRNDNVINLCEIKYATKEFVITKSYDENLRNKRGVFIEETKTKKSVHITMITTYGVKRNEYWNNIQSELILDDLFNSEISTPPLEISTPPPLVSTQPPFVSTQPPLVSTQPPLVSTQPPLVSTQPQLEIPKEVLDEISKMKKRINDEHKVMEIIKKLCSIRALTSDEIAGVLKKREDYIRRKYLTQMIEGKKLNYLHPEMINHPEQAYITNKKD